MCSDAKIGGNSFYRGHQKVADYAKLPNRLPMLPGWHVEMAMFIRTNKQVVNAARLPNNARLPNVVMIPYNAGWQSSSGITIRLPIMSRWQTMPGCQIWLTLIFLSYLVLKVPCHVLIPLDIFKFHLATLVVSIFVSIRFYCTDCVSISD